MFSCGAAVYVPSPPHCFQMKKMLLFILFACMYAVGFNQDARLITLDALNSRINHGKDTTYVINFWATWCAPCVKELPYFEKLNSNYKTGKLKVLLVSLDFISQLDSSVNPFIHSYKLQSEVFLLNEKNQQEFINRIDTSWSGALPATLFIKNTKRKFMERDFTYDELVHEYKLFNQ